MAKILRDKSFRLSIILTILFLATGLVFLYAGLAFYGATFFILLPVVLGISIGALPDRKWALAGLAVTVIAFLILLVVGQVEGVLCVILALGMIIPFIFLGYIIMHLIRHYAHLRTTDKLHVLALPLLIFVIAAPLERKLTPQAPVEEVITRTTLPYSAIEVYDAIKSVDTLRGEPSFLMKIDLPIPRKCVLEKEEIGGLRTCYFEGGTIVERITALEKGKIMRMDVIEYHLTGRNWLGFKEAIYTFESLDSGGCTLTRITTYTSELQPRFYWEPLERIGIEEEHQYVIQNLVNDLRSNASVQKNH